MQRVLLELGCQVQPAQTLWSSFVCMQALTDMDLLHWIAYTCIHTAASTPFFCEHLGYSVGLAVFKVCGCRCQEQHYSLR